MSELSIGQVAKRAGIGLAEIAEILADGGSEADALRAHLAELRDEYGRLGELIASIEQQIDRLESARITEPDSFYGAYTQEIDRFAERLGEEHLGAGSEIRAIAGFDALCSADLEHLAAHGTAIFERLAGLMTTGAATDDPATQEAVDDHFSAVRTHTELSLDAYRVLGTLYETDPLQRSIAARIHPELPGCWRRRSTRLFAVNLTRTAAPKHWAPRYTSGARLSRHRG